MPRDNDVVLWTHWPRILLVGLFLLLCPTPALRAQIVELSGGTSTLYEAQGATLKLLGAAYEGGVSGGVTGGHFLIGAYARRATPTATYTLGMQDLHLNLPTDLFGGAHRLAAVGLGAIGVRSGTNVEIFLGESSTRLDSPYVQGFSHLKPSAALSLSRAVNRRFTVSTQLLVAATSTALAGVAWRPYRSIGLAASGGFGGKHPFAAASLDLNQPRQSLQAEYIVAGEGFHRTGSQSDLTPEFVHENVTYTIRSSVMPQFTLNAARQNFITAVPTGATKSPVSTVNQISVSQQLKALRLSASIFESTYTGLANLAYTASAAFPVTTRIEAQGSFFSNHLLNRPGHDSQSLVTNLHERLSSHVLLSQTINHSAGQTSVGFGGSLQTSLGNLSIDSQTFYLPTRPSQPFQQTLMIDLQLTVLGRVLLHAGSFVSPTGKVLYTADAHATQSFVRMDATTTENYNLGTCVLRGRVVDEQGSAVVGAALEIAGRPVFTDSEGTFFLRERKPTLHAYSVLVNEFLDGQTYRVVSQPMELASTAAVPTQSLIVVARETDRSNP